MEKAHPPATPLTDREEEVTEQIRQGKSATASAAALGMSAGTVRAHLSSIFGKLGIGSQSQLALWAERRKIRREQKGEWSGLNIR